MRQALGPCRRQQDVGQADQKEGQQGRTPHEPYIVIDGRPCQGADQRRAGRHGRTSVPHINAAHDRPGRQERIEPGRARQQHEDDAQCTGRAERGPKQQAQQAAQQEDP